MSKSPSYGELRELCLNEYNPWRNGGGRKTAMIYSGAFQKEHGSNFPAKNITKKVMNNYQLILEDLGNSDSTINRKTSAVSTILKFAYDIGEIDFQPPRFQRRKEIGTIRKFYTKEQIERIAEVALNEFENEPLHDITLVAAYTAMRQGELLNMKAKDIDFLLNIIHVGGSSHNKTKTGNYRIVPISSRIKEILKTKCEYLAPNDYVFRTDWASRHMLLKTFRNVTHRYLGFGEGYCFHSLRHSFGHLGVEADISIRKIQKIMGHANINTTLRYADSSDKSLQEAIEKI